MLVKHVGDMQELLVILNPRHGYVPKVLSTLFRVQVITLLAVSASEEVQGANLRCLVRALRTFVEHSSQYWQSEQLFVCQPPPASWP